MFLLSCCRRRRRQTQKYDEEREPLVRKAKEETRNRIVSVIAAFQAGNLPSQQQLNDFLRFLLRVFDGEDEKRFIQSLLIVGMEKNSDDLIQDIIFRLSSLRIHTETPVSDFITLLSSLATLTFAILTSAALRTLLLALLATTRDFFANTAVRVGKMASQVQAGANEVERAVRADGETVLASTDWEGKANEAAEHIHDAGEVELEDDDKFKHVLVGQLQELGVQAHKDRHVHRALSAMLALLRAYAPLFSSGDPVDPALSPLLHSLRVLLERLSNTSLEPLLTSLYNLRADSHTSSEYMTLLIAFDAFITHSLAQPSFSTSPAGAYAAEAVYDRAYTIFSDGLGPLHHTIQEIQALINALTMDSALRRLGCSINALTPSLISLFSPFSWSELNKSQSLMTGVEIVRHVLMWAIPMLARAAPLLAPRVEYASSDGRIQGALDTRGMTVDLSTGHIAIRMQNEVCVEVDAWGESGNETGASERVNVRVRVEGAHAAVHRVRYAGAYTLFPESSWLAWLGFADAGASSAKLDLGVDIEVQLGEKEELFVIHSADVHVPKFALHLSSRRHPLLVPMLVTPLLILLRPFGRRALSRSMSVLIKEKLEALGHIIRKAQKQARRQSGDEIGSAAYIRAMLDVVSSAPVDEEEPSAATHIEPTLQGIIVHTGVSGEQEGEDEREEGDLFALGPSLGAPLLPDVPAPPVPSSGEIFHDAVEHLGEESAKVMGTVDGIADAAEEVCQGGLGAVVDRESEREGWRSDAFNFHFESYSDGYEDGEARV